MEVFTIDKSGESPPRKREPKKAITRNRLCVPGTVKLLTVPIFLLLYHLRNDLWYNNCIYTTNEKRFNK